MNILMLVMVLAVGAWFIRLREQRQRIALLAAHLGLYQIEKLMETLVQGYARALGEADADRRAQIWQLLQSSEAQLSEQFGKFAIVFAKVPEDQARVSKLAVLLPFATRLFSGATFDMRRMFEVHAAGIATAVAVAGDTGNPQDIKTRAFNISAEIFLMQHSCHWFCRSKSVASARLLIRHKTAYPQLLDALRPATRKAYLALAA